MRQQAASKKEWVSAQRKIRAMIGNPTKIIPKSTRKFDESVAMKRERERQRERESMAKKQEIQRKEMKMKQKWKGQIQRVTVDNTKALEQKRLQCQREAAAAQRANALHWKRQKKAIMKRVAERPLLVEMDRAKMEEQRAKKKAIVAVQKSLDTAGVSDTDAFFDQNERELIQNMKRMQQCL